MKLDDSSSVSRDDRLAELILRYVDSIEAGKPLDREQFINLNSEFQAELKQFFASRDQLESVAAPIRNAVNLDWGWQVNSAVAEPSGGGTGARTSSNNSGEVRALGQLGDFRLLREIGRGGMGIVYEAEQLSLQRRVALKVLPFAAAIDPKHILRFKNEALAAGMLNHPHIVPVYSVGNERGVHFYSMQLVEGQSLSALITGLRQQTAVVRGNVEDGAERRVGHAVTQTDTTLDSHHETESQFHRDLSTQHIRRDDRYFRTASRLILQAAEALQYAHESGIVHRDIKPANLLVDLGGQLRITDFGLAQFHSEVGLTRTGDTPGTLRYMSPEQAAGRRSIVDHRTDVYSLGATFYELLTLSPIFEAQDVRELLHQIFDLQPQPMRKRDKSIPVELETIVLKATNKSREDRYSTAGEMAADLRRYLDNQPILARPPSLIDRARKWARRHPSVVIASLVVLLVVSGVSLAAIILIDSAYHRERLRADEAEAQFLVARRSVDELVRVSEEELAFNPAAESVRRRLLTSVLSHYQEFIEQRRDDPGAQESLAEASQRVEKILNGLRALRAAGQIKLLRQASVVEELQLSEGQQRQSRELFSRVEELWHETFRDIGRVSAAELDRRSIERSRLNEADLKAILTPEQFRRLYQLDLQVDVAAAFREPEVAAKLKLTPMQRDQVKTIEQQEMVQWRKMHHPDSAKNSAAEVAGTKPPLSKNERILEVLTPDQAIEWRALTGTPLADLRR